MSVTYPAFYESDIVLRDGSTLHIRPLRPEDGPGLLVLLQQLTAQSRFVRFCTPMPETDEARLAFLMDVDYENNFALVGEVCGRLVAAAHCFRSLEEPALADVWFVTEEALQGRGIGMRMLELLAGVAREHGVGRFEAEIVGDNQRMMDVFFHSGYEVTSRQEGGHHHVSFSLSPTRTFEERHARRSREAAAASMKAFFEPRSVAVIGAGRTSGLGFKLFQNLIRCGFQGLVHPINARASHVCSVKAWPRITDLPDEVDLAVVCVPAQTVPEAVDDCIAKGVKGIIIVSSGFAECNLEGRELEKRILEKVRAAGIRMIGPNCVGVLNAAPAVSLNATFSPVWPRPGRVALSTQSGALGSAILSHMQRLHIGISSFASIGNKPDVSGNDLIQYWEEDPRTDLILLYLESFGNPRRFSNIARRVTRVKPIICVKSGRTGAGARAAGSHSASLASTESAVDALFRQAGIIRTDTIEEMLDVASLLAHQPLPAGRRVAVLTNAGGPAILAVDALEGRGLVLSDLDKATARDLRSFLPPTASVSNPVDMGAAATADDYRHALETLLADDGVDSVNVICIPLEAGDIPVVAASIAQAARSCQEKPVLATIMTSEGVPVELKGIPHYAFPESAAAALGHAVRYREWLQRPPGTVPVFEDLDPSSARSVVELALARGGGWLYPQEMQELLAAVGIPVVRQRPVPVDEGAVRDAAEAIGYPVVLKVVSPSLVHKSDVGGVLLDLRDEEALLAGYRDLVGRLGDRASGLLVQQWVPAGVEVVVGASVDRTFGPLLMVGSGGQQVELMGDVAFALHPLTDVDVDDMLGRVKGMALLRGYRGTARADEQALRQVLLRLSTLLEICPEIQEIDVNPLKVQPLEREEATPGAVALDARVRVSPQVRVPSRRIAY